MRQEKIYIINETMMDDLDGLLLSLQNFFCNIYSNHEINLEIERRTHEVLKSENDDHSNIQKT